MPRRHRNPTAGYGPEKFYGKDHCAKVKGQIDKITSRGTTTGHFGKFGNSDSSAGFLREKQLNDLFMKKLKFSVFIGEKI